MSISVEYNGRSVPGLPGRDEIIALCRQNGFETNGLKYPPNKSPIAYIKYGGRVNMGEMRTQRYIFNVFNEMNPAPGVKAPEVYFAFEYEGETYIVMEYVHGQTVAELLRDPSNSANWIYDVVTKAVTHLVGIPVPSDARPGPAGGEHVHHWFFRDNDAPTEYPSIDELQNHINKVVPSDMLLAPPFCSSPYCDHHAYDLQGSRHWRLKRESRFFQRATVFLLLRHLGAQFYHHRG
jgi:hypothetical protein